MVRFPYEWLLILVFAVEDAESEADSMYPNNSKTAGKYSSALSNNANIEDFFGGGSNTIQQ